MKTMRSRILALITCTKDFRKAWSSQLDAACCSASTIYVTTSASTIACVVNATVVTTRLHPEPGNCMNVKSKVAAREGFTFLEYFVWLILILLFS